MNTEMKLIGSISFVTIIRIFLDNSYSDFAVIQITIINGGKLYILNNPVDFYDSNYERSDFKETL
jgi:hypothetical protein